MSIFEPPFKDKIYDENRNMIRDWWMWFQEVFTDIVLNNTYRLRSTTRITSSDSPYTLTSSIKNLVCDTDGGAITVNFEAGVQNTNHRVSNVGTSSNDVTLNGNGSEKIAGESSQTLYDEETLNTYYDSTEGWW